MSAIGISGSCRFAPHIISAHADHRRADFVFARTQSPMLREAPWERRLKPLRTWSEIGAYGAAALAATVLVTAFI
ncbi:MAG TPA: hypothetical protein VII56_18415 [Rhizomicrobium sp.]